MKIAGLTWWRNNYGSILQAYALQSMIEKYDDVEYEILCQYGEKIFSADNALDKLKKYGLRETFKRAFWKFSMKKLRQRNANIQKFVDENLNVSKKHYNEDIISNANDDYDGFFCGSDQIWNTKLTPADSIYWLGFVEKGKHKVSYAPSVGTDEVSEAEAEIIRKNLADFDMISSREESGTALINKIVGKDVCQTVLDPTLLAPRDLWDNICPPRKYEEKYVFAYMLRGDKKQRKFIEKFASKKNLKVVTMPFLDSESIEKYDFKFGDIKLWDASPKEFISAIRYADYVFTDSFHCMVFSCLYHRTFYSFPKKGPAQMNRITGLQKLFGIPNRVLTEKTTVEDAENFTEIDWQNVDDTIEKQRAISLKYLDDAMKIMKS